VGDEPTGANHPELLKIKPSHGHDNTIVNGISRIGYMTGGRAARWVDEDMADVISGKAVEFIEKNRRQPFFLYFATHDAHVPRVPHPRFAGKSQCGTRGDVIQQLDWCVGEVLAALDRHQLAENTLVIFSSDNGGVIDDGYQDGSGNDTSGHRCNGPLRGFKGGLYEGGTRVPFLARWPARIEAGSTSDSLVCLVDLLATCAEIVGTPRDPQVGPDSVSMLPVLTGEVNDTVREHLVEQAGGGRLAIRQGTWKLIPAPNSGKNGNRAGDELYQLADDLGEERNLAGEHPEKVRELSELMGRIRQSDQSRRLVP
jgi:arylsulfatase A-like enzyme